MFRWLIAGLLLAGCTTASLETLPPPPEPVVDDRITIDGEVCTESPEDVSFPTRVLFLVDSSESMEAHDPPDPATGRTRREVAVQETLIELFEDGRDVKVSLVRFSSQVQPLTVVTDADGVFEGYFTDSLEAALSVLPLIAETDRTTNFINALSEAYAQIRDEMDQSELESRVLSSYHVVLISDGIPDAEGSEGDGPILDAVSQILDLKALFDASEVTVSTALISTGNAEVDAVAEDLLQEMAERGGGYFRSFATNEPLNFLNLDLTSLKRVFTLRSLVVQNLNTTIIGDEVLPDSDGDGMIDAEEAFYGTDPTMPDSDGDGCRDGTELILASGLDPLNSEDCNCFLPDFCFDTDKDGVCDNGCEDRDGDSLCDCIDVDLDGVCDPENFLDSDGDGLTDCEEGWTGTNKSGPDTDADGLSDLHEFRFGTSPDVHDAEDDLDWDQVPNGEEVKSGTDPTQASDNRYERAYRYKVAESRRLPGGRTCFSFEVANVSLAEMMAGEDMKPTRGPAGQGFSGSNRALIFAGEVPSDNQDTFARLRVACVEARLSLDGNYRNPPSGRMSVDNDDFVSLTAFDPAVHCVDPMDAPEEQP
ncbi:MAG: VWA domain-containing protein [Myxococcota bacterium]